MSLNLNKLEKVRDVGGGMIHARCPACAEGGHDRTGEHLRIYPDGRFGCCVHPKDREHRKRIFALAGERSPRRGIVVRVSAKQPATIQRELLGRLGRVFESPKNSDASDGANRVETEVEEVRTARTNETESNGETLELFRTPRTPSSLLPRVREEKEEIDHICTKEFCSPVRSVRSSEGKSNPPKKERLPFFTSDGTLSIPFDSPERYHWWKGGQSVAQTIAELRERKENHASEF